MEYLSSQEYRHIVRIVGNDIPGERKLLLGLTQIKGIGYNFATAIASTLKINKNSNIGYHTEENVQAIEKLILNYCVDPNTIPDGEIYEWGVYNEQDEWEDIYIETVHNEENLPYFYLDRYKVDPWEEDQDRNTEENEIKLFNEGK